jgi:ABC-type branched-subunit amino acid transport system substrate-binding protein
LVGAPVPASRRYRAQGLQMQAGLELWARRAGARLLLEDDQSTPALAARLHAELRARGCRFVLGPYGSDSTRAVAEGRPGIVWNHGAAADDVQRLPGVVSLASPASRYLVALGLAVALLRPGASVALVVAAGRFPRYAREGLEREAVCLGLTLLGSFSFRDPPAAVVEHRPEAVLLCGPSAREVALLRALSRLAPWALLGGVSPGLAAFPTLLGSDPEGLLAPVQWHADLPGAPRLGASSSELVADARASGFGELDYVAAQAYAAALVAAHCLELEPEDPLAATRRLRTTTCFGAFRARPQGLQRGHRLAVVRWRGGRRELLLADAA